MHSSHCLTLTMEVVVPWTYFKTSISTHSFTKMEMLEETASTSTRISWTIIIRLVQNDRKLATQVPSSNFRRFRAYLMAFERIISPKFPCSCEKSPGIETKLERESFKCLKKFFTHIHICPFARTKRSLDRGDYRVTLPSCFMFFLCLTVFATVVP